MYEALPFPLRDPETEKSRLLTTPPDMLSRINHYCFAGRQSFGNDFRALVAGGGTGDAVIHLAQQLSQRGNGTVTYLDMCEKSMEVARQRAAVRGLQNVEWVHASILDIPELDLGRFDYINCMGVLHHMSSPIQGLRCLEGVLADDGAMALMVYGRYGRIGVTVVQDMLKIILGEEGDIHERVSVATAMLQSLSPLSAFMRGRDRIKVLETLKDDPNNVADIFLHPCDHPFTASEFVAMATQCGLHLASFTTYSSLPAITRLQYDPVRMAQGDDIKPYLAALPFDRQIDIAEMMDGNLHLHTAYFSRRANGAVADFADPANIPFLPTTNAGHACAALAASTADGLNVQLASGNSLHLRCTPATLAFLRRINDRTSLGEIFADLQREGFARTDLDKNLELMNAFDWILLRHPSVAAFPVVGAPMFAAGSDPFANLGPRPWSIPYCQPAMQQH